MKAISLTQEQQKFIRENYKNLSRLDMEIHLKCSLHRIRKFMIDNNLTLEKGEAQEIRYKKNIEESNVKSIEKEEVYQKPKWIRNPWDNMINTVTMQKGV